MHHLATLLSLRYKLEQGVQQAMYYILTPSKYPPPPPFFFLPLSGLVFFFFLPCAFSSSTPTFLLTILLVVSAPTQHFTLYILHWLDFPQILPLAISLTMGGRKDLGRREEGLEAT